MPPLPKTLQAVFLMIASMALFATMSSVIRLLSGEMHPMQMVFLRNIFGLLVIFAWTSVLYRRIPRFPTLRLRQHFWRATVGVVSMELWFYCLSVMPLTLATALSFTTPIFSTIFAIVFLGERAGIRRWSAIGIGFAGMLVILRPDLGGIHSTAMFVLISSALMAIVGVLIKTLTRTEPPETIVFYMSLFMTPWSAAPAYFHWQAITAHQLGLVGLIAFLSTAAHLMLARALARAEMVVLMPLDFTRLIFVSFLAYVLFGETLSLSTVAGSFIIVGSCVYIAHREAVLKRPNTTVEFKP